MSELILKGTDLFMGKTGIADTLPISGIQKESCFCSWGSCLFLQELKCTV